MRDTEIEVLADDWRTIGDDLWLAMIRVVDSLSESQREDLQRQLMAWAERLSRSLLEELGRILFELQRFQNESPQLRLDLGFGRKHDG
jgi:hypothetical protein